MEAFAQCLDLCKVSIANSVGIYLVSDSLESLDDSASIAEMSLYFLPALIDYRLLVIRQHDWLVRPILLESPN